MYKRCDWVLYWLISISTKADIGKTKAIKRSRHVFSSSKIYSRKNTDVILEYLSCLDPALKRNFQVNCNRRSCPRNRNSCNYILTMLSKYSVQVQVFHLYVNTYSVTTLHSHIWMDLLDFWAMILLLKSLSLCVEMLNGAKLLTFC